MQWHHGSLGTLCRFAVKVWHPARNAGNKVALLTPFHSAGELANAGSVKLRAKLLKPMVPVVGGIWLGLLCFVLAILVAVLAVLAD